MNSCCFMLVYLSHQIYASSETHYECGAHGKFEYCVDEEAGCVVGCHCHPGYYFDTDTKVCEPNIKLTQFRRQFNPMYEAEPTRVPTMNYDYASLPKLTTLNPVDTKVEEIAKDTDDLGDWLYNQFFKTIENQVINNTNSEVKTRRTGDGGRPVKPKRRSHKKSKRSRSKKKKRRGLKSKLLRISEDDSLFDSSSSSSSDESDSTSSESGSDSSSDHDHRKIVMYNKKPTPPLPSFIFLPNVETPFYPPIGLPAPPILQMYPMIPVPPMGAVICNSTTEPPSTTSKSSSKTTPDDAKKHDNLKTTSENNEAGSVTEANPENTGAPETNDAPAGRAGTRSERNNKMAHRNKFLQKIRDKMKRRNKRPPVPHVMEEFQDPGGPIVDENDVQSMEHPILTNKGLPKLEDVDFKYLTQLIHKIDLNKTAPLVPPPFNPMLNYPEVEGLSPLLQRRNYQNAPYHLNKQNYGNLVPNYQNSMPLTYAQINHKSRPASKADDVNDTYYTNLGKEIASLIRNIDDKGEHVIDIELQHQNALQPVGLLNGNRFGPGRSYWERFARSPLKDLIPFLKKIDSNYTPQSGENLVDIENKVNVATAIERSFSLQELETMANIMTLAKLTANGHQNRGTERSTMRSSAHPIFDFTFNLLPDTIRRNNPVVQETAASDKDNVMNQVELSEVRNQHYQKFIRRPPPKSSPLNLNNKNETLNNRTRHVDDIIKMNSLKNLLKAQNYQTPLQQQVSRLVLAERNITNPLTAQQLTVYQVKPALLNYRNVNYMNNNHNHNKLHVQRSLIPIQMPQHAVPSHMANHIRPSYFHHQLHHFDYFD